MPTLTMLDLAVVTLFHALWTLAIDAVVIVVAIGVVAIVLRKAGR